MTKHRDLKDRIRAHQAAAQAAGRPISYAQARREVLNAAASATIPAALVLTVDFPRPTSPAEPCSSCAGTGLSGHTLLTQLDDAPDTGARRLLVVDTFCTDCLGCGRADHDQCGPATHPASDSYHDELEDLERDEHELADPCPSCGPGRPGWNLNVVYQPGPDGDDEGEALYVRMPCGCTQDRIRALPDKEAAAILDGMPAQADPRYPQDWMAAFSGPEGLPFPVNGLFLSGLQGRPPVHLCRRREDDDGDLTDVFVFESFDHGRNIGRYRWIAEAASDDEVEAVLERRRRQGREEDAR